MRPGLYSFGRCLAFSALVSNSRSRSIAADGGLASLGAKTVILLILIAGKLDFQAIDPHCRATDLKVNRAIFLVEAVEIFLKGARAGGWSARATGLSCREAAPRRCHR